MHTFCLKSGVLGLCLLSNAIQAELTPLVVPILNGTNYIGNSVIADSTDNKLSPFRDRIYYYDLAVDSNGKAYILYANPVPKVQNSTAGIIYDDNAISNNETSEVWLAVENETGWNKIPITGYGSYNPMGLHLQLDSKGILHLSYIEKRLVSFGTDTKVQDRLVYRTFNNGALSAEILVGDLSKGNVAGLGGWRTYMAIAPDDQVYFLREGSTATDANKPFLKLLIPDGTGNWAATELNFTVGPSPAANWYHLGGFVIDSQGVAHITFGDYAYNQQGQKYSFQSDPVNDNERKSKGYHNLWYASSNTLDGKGWVAFQLNEDPTKTLPTLYEQEFWVNLALDEQNNPAVTTWLHSVGTSNMKYNTSAFTFIKNSEGSWRGQRITRVFDGLNYKANGYVEGMGAGLVKDQFGWHGVWDDSHSRPFDHDSRRGGLVYRFSPDGKNWDDYQVLAEFSGEGASIVKIDKQNRLNVLVLGDNTNTQLYFLRYQLPSNNLMEVSPDRKFYYNGESITLNAQVRNAAVGDFYVAVVGDARPEIQQAAEIWQLNSAFAWEQISNFNQLKPTVSLGQGISFNAPINIVGSKQAPFKNPDTNYTIYAAVAKSGTDVLTPANWVTPLFSRQIIANKTLPFQ